jgi:glycosyltransferase involved in cell wall biosynthesis
MSVSLALIVRDEEDTLGRCLDSVAAAVDEIVVVDTGSQDGTVEVARRYTDQIHHFTWVQDFAAARQFAFDQAHGDWIGWVDADDVVTGADAMRRVTAAAPAEVGAIHAPYVISWDGYGNPTCQFWRERLVRNDGSYRWQGRVHEVLVSDHPWQVSHCEDLVIKHHPTAHGEDSTGRNLAILEAELAECEDAPPARLLFYLGREYADAGQPERALEIFGLHLQRCTWDDERYQALLRVAEIHLDLGNSEEAADTLWQALKLCPHWPGAYFALARIYYFRQDWHKVVHWTEIGRAMPWPQTSLFINPMDLRANWIIYYTNALYQLGDVTAALAWTRQALAIYPGDPAHRHNLAFFQQAFIEVPRQKRQGAGDFDSVGPMMATNSKSPAHAEMSGSRS